MTPIDPYFTSAVKGEQRRPRHVSKGKLKNPDKKARERIIRARRKGRPTFVTGSKSKTGFKPPRKVWH
jgi:hypothetical protein